MLQSDIAQPGQFELAQTWTLIARNRLFGVQCEHESILAPEEKQMRIKPQPLAIVRSGNPPPVGNCANENILF